MKRGIVMELTPLLDVIMILLFLVLTSVSTQVSTAQETAEAEATAAAERESELASALDEAQQGQQKAEQALSSFILVDENCRIVTLTLANTGESRALTISGDGLPDWTIPLTWGEETYEENALNAALKGASALPSGGTEQVVFFVFQYDRRKIYQADYELIHKGLLRCSGGNTYFAEYDMTE